MSDIDSWVAKMQGECPQCGEPFLKNIPKQKFCNRTCAVKWHQAERRRLVALARESEKGKKK